MKSLSRTKQFAISLSCASLLAFVFAMPVNATQIFYYTAENTDDGTPPEGLTPWLTAKFEDTATDEVTLTLSSLGLIEEEIVSKWYFNYNGDSDDFQNLKLSFQEFTLGQATIDQDSINGSGQGKFDIGISFGPTNFKAEHFSVWKFFGVDGLTASDFLSYSNKGILATAHVQKIDTPGTNDQEKSGWVIAGVPEPNIAILLGLGLVGLGAFRRQ